MIFVVVVVVAFFFPLDVDFLSRKGICWSLDVHLCCFAFGNRMHSSHLQERIFLELYLHELTFSEDKPLQGFEQNAFL